VNRYWRRFLNGIGWLRAELMVALMKARGRRITVGTRPIFWRGRPTLAVYGKLTVGNDWKMFGKPYPARITIEPGAEIRTGDNFGLNYGVEIYAAKSITMGDNAMIGDQVTIYDTDFHRIDEGGEVRVAPVTIGDNVWLGRGATVLPGVSIGDHSIVAAGAVVAKDVPARTVVAGNPARPVRDVKASDDWRRY
jgi:acetyltransferase-like isoleucine patch superfamily enzyme